MNKEKEGRCEKGTKRKRRDVRKKKGNKERCEKRTKKTIGDVRKEERRGGEM